MTVLELHPDDLIDKQMDGTLSEDERVRLDAHLAQCSACRLECILRADFDEELGTRQETPSVRIVVTDVLKQPLTVTPAPKKASATLRWSKIAMVAAAALSLTGLAAAKDSPVRGVFRSLQGLFVSTVEPPLPSAPESQKRDSVVMAPIAVATVGSVPEPMVSAVVEPVIRAVPAPSSVLAPAPKTAEMLFAEARTLRSSGKIDAAEQAYADLIARHPGTSAGKTALAVSARMHLDHGNATLALARYSAYLNSGHGALREDALAGRALALGKLGRADEASRAWDELFSAYPNSSYAKSKRATY